METASLDSRKFRDALGHYPSGVAIITGMVDGLPVGFTCQSFYSVSIEPPLISFSVMKSSASWPRIRPVERCAVNILAGDQSELSNIFGRSSGDRWANVRWMTSAYGNPIIENVLLWLDCGPYAEYEAGDHWVVICRVHDLSYSSNKGDGSPLVYYKGQYRQLLAI